MGQSASGLASINLSIRTYVHVWVYDRTQILTISLL